MMPSLLIPFDRRWETFCPFCWSPGTEYHPNERRGRCMECSGRWEFPPHSRPLNDWTPARESWEGK